MTVGKRTISLMGTVIQIWVQSPKATELLQEAERRLVDYEARFSANREDSELMQVNYEAGRKAISVDAELFSLIRLGKAQSLAPGFLNIAIGPLIQLWRVGFQDARKPTTAEIRGVLPVIDPQKIVLDEAKHTVFLAEAGMAIDLGALAKGYFADQIMAYFKAEGASAGYIDLGGNVLTFGEAPNHADGYWRVGIQNPFLPRGNYLLVLKIKNQTVVTSGIYERKFEFSGRTYHHLFDSHTGYPLETELASVTIVSNRSVDGEVLTTRLFDQTPAQWIQSVEQLPEVEGVVVTKNGMMAHTTGLIVDQ